MKKFLVWLKKPNVLSTVKTITYKIVSGTTTYAIVYLWTGDSKGSGHATIALMAIHMFQYWIHERIWLIWETSKND